MQCTMGVSYRSACEVLTDPVKTVQFHTTVAGNCTRLDVLTKYIDAFLWLLISDLKESRESRYVTHAV